ncbi:hypothetical protein [Streptomyces sp. NPDC002785]|uniref:hypothetical protein n=1 Tax=Streptomyces sp. NPDC002785 TaxID=3154543 RepID=UPI0033209F91
MGKPTDLIPDLGRCLHLVGGQALLGFPGAPRRLRLPARPVWTRLAARNVGAVLLLGLDPLPQTVDVDRVDAYLDTDLDAERLLFGQTRTS